MKVYIVKGFNKEEYPEDYMEYIAAVVLDEAEANALAERLEREQNYWLYTVEDYEVGRIYNDEI
jgi:predicted Zn-dependent peptidase